ncbi:uncharacterized mitochondrial protein AtMg00810-like [Vicia villosa]|uniref:uncharacterized mitochondrial protein AtMg00810-like n=1 Tax=Vicia villosa TaxID=3911 RepID=UPI00273AD264|nr:uncharacterized mitochondrial protein AtMg00810-like [Vicia villosa]
MDVNFAFLNDHINEEVYVSQPIGFEDRDNADYVFKLKRAYMVSNKLMEVDDIIFGSIDESLCREFASLMQRKFEMSLIGELTYFLGLQIKQDEVGIFISQTKYYLELLKKFDMKDSKSISTPMKSIVLIDKDER